MLLGFSTQLQDINVFLDQEKHCIRPPIPSFDSSPTPPVLNNRVSTSFAKDAEVTGITSDRPSWTTEKIPFDCSRGPKAVATKVLEKLNEIDEPIALVDLGKVKSRHALWVNHLPLITPFYAVKCNPDPMIIRTLDSLGVNFDCATKDEIATVLTQGITPDRIIFSNPCKPRTHLQYAKESGVDLMVFDNTTELWKIADVFPEAKLLLRLRCEDAGAQCPLSMKFGAGPDQWRELIKEAKRHELSFVGVSFHVGSGCQTPGTFDQALADAKQIFILAQEFGLPPLTILDIGGGFPGDDGSHSAVSFPVLASRITQALHATFSDDELSAMRLISEPGRFYAMQSTDLLTKVFAKAKIPPNAEESACVGKYRYYLNDGLYGSFNCILYDHATVHPSVMRDEEVSSGPPCTLFGPTCDGFDTIEANVTYLPELHEGEWLLWTNMGAYTSAAGSTFNGFPKPINWYYESIPGEKFIIAITDARD
eukprot:GEMP01021187.1.p1 GENE.GEMP01021187.1~~GEMP01021187.1.p1  ORF type:complete len:561 (+),score=62.83 GEMP01021187.1:244-1683(+)